MELSAAGSVKIRSCEMISIERRSKMTPINKLKTGDTFRVGDYDYRVERVRPSQLTDENGNHNLALEIVSSVDSVLLDCKYGVFRSDSMLLFLPKGGMEILECDVNELNTFFPLL